jgi:hypothetical protein
MWHKKILFGLLLVFVGVRALCQNVPDDYYKAATIPDSLKENANSVIRFSENIINIKGPGKAVMKVHEIVTILNEKADREAIMVIGYNKKYDNCSNFEMRVYNATGVQIKRYYKSDLYDGSAADDETMVTNERYLALKHAVASYPTTVEVKYEKDISSFISLSSWDIQATVEQSVQYALCKVTANSATGFRFKNENTDVKPVKENAGDADTYTWEVKNLKAIKKEEHVLLWKVLPSVSFAVNSFDCYGYPGDFTSWQSFGKWIQALNSDVCMLSPERITEVRKMTDTIKTDKEKARFLYNYMQKSMRYVSIQLGIGGFKPFPATFVDQKKYGDCKALSNYMRALLKAVSIESHYAIIRAGTNEEPADLAFPYNQFNHAILCIPFKNDTTWLECTSNTQPFGKLGSFTENRNALIITDEGGKLVNTPRSTIQDNQFNSEVHLLLEPDGSAKAEVKIFGSGGYRERYIGVESLKLDDQKEDYIRALNIKQPITFDIKPGDDKNGIKQINLALAYDKYCDIMAGNKQFYRPNVIDLWGATLPVEENRKNAYYFDTPLQKKCVTVIDLPTGFEVESLPANQNLKFYAGNYEVSYTYDAPKNQVISTAKFNITNQVIPAAKYTELQEYLDAVTKAQNKKLVIKRKA